MVVKGDSKILVVTFAISLHQILQCNNEKYTIENYANDNPVHRLYNLIDTTVRCGDISKRLDYFHKI